MTEEYILLYSICIGGIIPLICFIIGACAAQRSPPAGFRMAIEDSSSEDSESEEEEENPEETNDGSSSEEVPSSEEEVEEGNTSDEANDGSASDEEISLTKVPTKRGIKMYKLPTNSFLLMRRRRARKVFLAKKAEESSSSEEEVEETDIVRDECKKIIEDLPLNAQQKDGVRGVVNAIVDSTIFKDLLANCDLTVDSILNSGIMSDAEQKAVRDALKN